MSSSQDMGRSNKSSSTQIAVQEQNRLNEKPKIEENQNVVQQNNTNKQFLHIANDEGLISFLTMYGKSPAEAGIPLTILSRLATKLTT